MLVATLIAAERLSEEDVQLGCELLRFDGAAPEPFWLEQGKACDLFYDGEPDLGDGHPLEGIALDRMRVDGQLSGVDVVVQPVAGREKKLLIADMDSTMITVECLDELADYAGLKPQIAAITDRAMRGEFDFAGALDARVTLLAGLDEAAIDRCLAERVRLMPGARELVATMRARGAYTVLVSGGFTRFAEPVGKMLGFDRVIANRLEIADGKLTGTVAKPIVDAGTKKATLLAERARLGLPDAATLAVGDGANDLDMVRVAGLGVAYRAKPVVAAAAAARIDHGDLTALLYAQGIPRAEWVVT